MKKFYFLIVVAILASCNTLKRAEKSINAGDYNQAFDLIVKKYQNGVSDKNFEKFLPAFQEAYVKMVTAEESKIERLNQANNPAYTKDIYETLMNLNHRQNQLKALLPIVHNDKIVNFPTKNYNNALQNAKSEYVTYLYDSSLDKLNSGDKKIIRNAYYNLKTIEELSPNYADTRNLMQRAHYEGTDFVLVQMENKSNQLIPRRLERDLTQMNTYGLDDFWVEFHENQQAKIEYDYLIQLDFERILVSPERMNSTHHRYERDIVDGWEYLYQNGQQVVDSLGNPIKVDRYITVRANVEETFQEKDAMVQGEVSIINLNTNQMLDREKLYSEFGFRNHFARFDGDRRALDNDLIQLANSRPMPFPSHEQMVYDCGEEIKSQMKRMLRRMF